MYCSKCGAELSANVKFCGSCGKQVEMLGEGTTVQNSSAKNKMVIILGTAAAVVVIALCVVFLGKGGTNSSAVNVTKAIMTAIDKQDVDGLLACVLPENVEEVEEYGAEYKIIIKEMLEEMDEYFEEEFGKNWSRKVTYEAISDTEVDVTIDGETETFEVEKVKGKYYVDAYNLF